MHGAIDSEPERYIAEKPYDLTKFEFAVLRRRVKSEYWFNLIAGATAGVAISVVGKVLAALIEKQVPTLETWEIWAFLIGLLLALCTKFVRSKEDMDRSQLETVIDGHFTTNRPRRVHLTNSTEER